MPVRASCVLLSGNLPGRHRHARRHFSQQTAEALDGLTDVEVALDVPALHRNGVKYRYAELLLQALHEIEGPPRGTEHVDRLGRVVPAEGVLDESIDPIARQLRHLVEGDTLHSCHLQALEAGIHKILPVDA